MGLFLEIFGKKMFFYNMFLEIRAKIKWM